MNTATAPKPIAAARQPLSMESVPSVGSTVRSSSTRSGAGSAPARSTSARSFASSSENAPSMTASPPGIEVRMNGAE